MTMTEHSRLIYNRWHANDQKTNKSARMDREKFGLSGDYDKDLAAGKIDPFGKPVR